MNSIALGFRSNDRAGPPPFGRQAGVPTPALKHPTHSRQYMSETGGRVGLGQQSTARRATQHAEAERRRDLCDVAPTSPVHTLCLAQSLFGRHRTAHTVPPARDHALSWSGRSPRSPSESSHSLRPMPRPASTVLRRSSSMQMACFPSSTVVKHTKKKERERKFPKEESSQKKVHPQNTSQ